MKLKDLLEKYGEYEVIDETKFKTWDATLPKERSGSIQIEGREGIQIRLEPPKPKSVWDLEERDTIFTINCDGFIEDDKWYGCFDDERDNGNVFLTYEEAEKDLERRKTETLLLKHGGHRWAREGVNYRLGLQYNMVVICKDMYPLQGAIYFDLEQEAQKAIDEIGEDRIKRALFEVR